MADLERLRRDLRAFASAIGLGLTEWQAGSVELRRRITVVVAPRQSGKSRTLVALALWWAYRQPGIRVMVVSASEDASRRLLAEAVRVAMGSSLLRGSVVDDSVATLKLSNGSELRSVPQSEKAIRGWSVDLLLVDEAAQVTDEILLGAAMPTVAARPDARVVLAGSPGDQAGAFYDHFRVAAAGSEHVEAFTWALHQASWISPAVIAAARESLPGALFAREYEGLFSDPGAEEAVIPRGWVEAAQAVSLEEAGRRTYGLDVARFGADSSVCVRATGGVVRVVWAVQGADLMAVSGRAKVTLEEAPGRVWVDETGVGGGVLDRLRELRCDAAGWIAAARARNASRFANAKAEAWWEVRDLFRQGRVDLDPADRELAEQFASVRYALTPAGQIVIVSKAETPGASPDRADAAVLALHGARGGPFVDVQVPQGRIPAPAKPMLVSPATPGHAPAGIQPWQLRMTRRIRARPKGDAGA